jgi:ribosome-binding factor A
VSRRTERIGSVIRQELAQIMLRELNDPRLQGLPSITRVKVSPDLSIADVYITVLGTDVQQNTTLNGLRHSAGMMRAKLTRQIALRQSPFLKFHIDENLKRELAVLDLLRKVELEREEAQSVMEESAADASAPDVTTPEVATPEATTPEASTPQETTEATTSEEPKTES